MLSAKGQIRGLGCCVNDLSTIVLEQSVQIERLREVDRLWSIINSQNVAERESIKEECDPDASEKKTMEYNPRLKHPFTGMVVGPAQCGKTTLVLNLIERADDAIVPLPERFIWCYDKFSPAADLVDKEIKFVDGLPDVEDLLDDSRRTLIAIEDLLSERDQRVSKLFTKGSHHRNVSVIYVSQNLYSKIKKTERSV